MSAWIRALIDRFPLLSAIVKSRRVQFVILLARRQRIVSSHARFVAFELLAQTGRAAIYRLADAPDLRVVVRHRTRDVDVLDEIFGRQAVYDPPPEALASLDGRPPLNVVDLGGNVGLFGTYVLTRFPDARLTSIEPDPSNAAILRRCIALNAPDRWELIEACALNHSGHVWFEGGLFADSHVADRPGAGRSTPCVDVMPLLAEADLVKIDIEGSEWPLLSDPRFAVTVGAAALFLEWHPHRCTEPDPRVLAIRQVQGAGYEVLPSPVGPWRDESLWAWRAPLAPAGR